MQKFIQDFADGAGPGSNGGYFLRLREQKFRFFQTGKFSKNVKKQIKIYNFFENL